MKDKKITKEIIDSYTKKESMAYLNYVDMDCMEDIEPENQPWLWENVIPLNDFTLFAGVGALGKSQLLMFIAAHVSNGKSFEAGGMTHQLPQGAVIILSSEDHKKRSVSPRLLALGADNSQIYKINSISSSNMPFKKRLMALDDDLLLLRQTIIALKEQKGHVVKLIIVDPIINFMGKTKDYINTEVSNFLYGLSDLADEFNLAIILNKHLRKKDSTSSAGSAIDEIAGSNAWVTTARQVWIICRDHEDQKKILFLDGKTNIKQSMNGFAYMIKGAETLSKKNNIIKTSRIEWLSERVAISPDEAVSVEKYEKSQLTKAIAFVLSYLKKYGQSLIKNVVDEASRQKISERTIQRAYGDLIKDNTIKKERGISGYTLNFKDS